MAQQATRDYTGSAQASAGPAILGRQDYGSVVLRLVGMELYKIRRRAMSKVLSIICIVATILLYAFVALVVFFATKYSPLGNSTTISEPLRLPFSIFLTGQLLLSLGQVLIIILVSTIVGGEYTASTIRLVLSRGPSRTQIFLAKIGASLVCVALGTLGITALGIIGGLLFNLTTGIGQGFHFLDAAWIGHFLLYLLIVMLALFIYGMMALFLSLLGRSIAAGIAGVLGWFYIIEPVVGFLSLIGSRLNGGASSVFQALPNYFIASNLSALLQNQDAALSNSVVSLQLGAQGTVSEVHALLVLAAYLVIFIGIAWWVFKQRDITN